MEVDSVSPGGIISGTGEVKIDGSIFAVMGGSPTVVLENVLSEKVTEVVPNFYDNSVVKFSTPSVQAGKYRVRTRVDPHG